MSRFIVVEGVDGAGKSTLVRMLAELLQADGFDVLTTREPGGTPKAEAIRSFLLSDEGARVPVGEQLRMVHKGRVDHVETKIVPALKNGTIVISDRYELSSWVYQVVHDRETLAPEFFAMQAELQQLLTETVPEYLFLDLPEVEVERRLKESKKLNHFDATSLEAIAARREAYHDGVRSVSRIAHHIDATASPQTVVAESRKRLGI
jgi:dTMP kinase